MSGQPLLLKNGRIIDPLNNVDETADLLVTADQCCRVDQGSELPDNVELLDLSGKWVMPGWLDMHVHLREPGQEYKETIASGTRAAAAGGFTAVACMPNTVPVNDNQSVTRFILEQARNQAARVYPVGAISKGGQGQDLAEFGEMAAAGVTAVSDDGRPVTDSQLMRRALEYASNFNLLVISHAEELSLSRNGVMNEGEVATRMGLRGIPRAAEEVMVYRDLSLAIMLGLPIHIAHISTRESVSLIRRAKAMGALVTAETAPHYFTLTEEAVKGYNTRAKMNPPLRSADDVAAIREGLIDGTIDAIATDHAPHSILEKEVEFDLAANGIIGLETAAPLTLELINSGLMTPARMVELLSINPARILHQPGGNLLHGAVVDITVIDPGREFILTEEMIASKSCNTPFLNCTLKGKAVLTIVAGRVTYRDLG